MLGQKFLAVNGGSRNKLGEGGETGVCGWLTDRYGLAWQIAPATAEDFIYGPDPEAAQRPVEATYGMTKIDMVALERTYRGG